MGRSRFFLPWFSEESLCTRPGKRLHNMRFSWENFRSFYGQCSIAMQQITRGYLKMKKHCQMLHVWNMYLHVAKKLPKFRSIIHTWSIWERIFLGQLQCHADALPWERLATVVAVWWPQSCNDCDLRSPTACTLRILLFTKTGYILHVFLTNVGIVFYFVWGDEDIWQI